MPHAFKAPENVVEESGLARRYFMKTMPYVRKLLWLFWLLLLPLMIYLIVVDLVFVFWELFIYEVGEEQKLFLTAIAAALAFVPLGLWYWSGRRSRSQKRRWHPCLVICGIVAGAGACLFFNGILHWLPLPAEGYYEVKRVLYRPSLWIQFISMGLVIPVAEELVFRGLGYGRLRRELSAGTANALSAVWFGLYHGNLVQGIYAGFLGALAAAFYEVSDSLWICCLFHGAANVTAIMGTRYFSGENTGILTMRKPEIIAFGSLLLIVAVIIFFPYTRSSKTAANKIRRDGEKT